MNSPATRLFEVGLALSLYRVVAFAPPCPSFVLSPARGARRPVCSLQLDPFRPAEGGGDVKMYLFKRLFRRNKNGDDQKGDDNEAPDKDDNVEKESVSAAKENAGTRSTPFFAQVEEEVVSAPPSERESEPVAEVSETLTDVPTEEAEVTDVTEAAAPAGAKMNTDAPGKEEEEQDKAAKALEEAKALRAAAQKARLEAEKLDAMLSLEKITKLEEELSELPADAKDRSQRETQIRGQIDMLQRKLRGESVAPAPTSTVVAPSPDAIVGDALEGDGTTTSALSTEIEVKPSVSPLSQSELKKRVSGFESTPTFLRKLVARAAGIDFDGAMDINATAVVVKLHEDEQKALISNVDLQTADLSEPPVFTAEQIQEKIDSYKDVPAFVKNILVPVDPEQAGNDTAFAISLLKDEWKVNQTMATWDQIINAAESIDDSDGSASEDKPGESTSGGGFWQQSPLFGGMENGKDKSDKDRLIESLFPKSSRKDGEAPTEAQVEILMGEVLGKTRGAFNPTGRPEAVSGGFLIRGTSKFREGTGKDGEEVVKAIDEKLATSRVRDDLSVFFINDPTPVSDDQIATGERPPLLYVTGRNVAMDRNRIARTALSSVGLATTYYMSVYPFLLNPQLMSKANEQLALADAGIDFDASWLSDLSAPLLLSFLGIQVAHEVGHRVAAAANGMNITIPTLIPSVVTGITSSITALKSPPKNKQALFDFAISGPLAGMLASLVLLLVGAQLTSASDAQAYASLPYLPIDFLRQSSLGGGIIEAFLGDGVLNSPAGVNIGQAAATSNIALHPLAISGYIGLLVNAFSLLPFGRTDGGRVGLALFGRSGLQLVGFMTSLALFIAGLFGSDLILFYASFILFFQGEQEIPLRNEVDEIDFSRVLIATAAGVLVLLALIPM